jgi:hypothetical protein
LGINLQVDDNVPKRGKIRKTWGHAPYLLAIRKDLKWD